LSTPCTMTNLEDQVVWIITFDLYSIVDPASSYTTTGIALRIIWQCKPHHYIKVGIPVGGSYILWHICSKQELWSQRNSHC
jgi:hypothetical protein